MKAVPPDRRFLQLSAGQGKLRMEQDFVSLEMESFSSRTGGNENTGLLKILAVLFMITDHVGVAFFPQMIELRIIGRIAMPLFAWCLCVGAEYTRNIWKYALRLLLVGIIAQPCFMLGLNHEWRELNVYATLLCGLLGIAAIREKRFGSQYWGPVLVILISCLLKMDYGWQGVAFIMVLYGCRKSRSSITALMFAFCLYWGQGTYSIRSAFGIPAITEISFLPNAKRLLADIARIEFWAILALPLMILPLKKNWKLPKWVWYSIYPVHLLIIGMIRHWDEISGYISQWM